MKETILTGASTDILSQNLQKLKELFPEVFSEERIDFDKLRAVLGDAVDESEERYNFTWWGKSRALRLAQTPSMGTLRPCKEESKHWDTTENLYIEGDNLEVFKLLQKSYHNRVKLIYIDPPYNTGNDFVYKDDYADPLQSYLKMTGQADEEGRKLSTNSEASGRYHTNWLNMMYPRLRLARNLLREDGVIFISIDDNEVENLRKICDEIFGEENFISQVTVQSNPRGRQSDSFLATVHDYVLIFAKSINDCILSGIPLSEEQKAEFNLVDDNGDRYRLLGLRQRGSASRREDRPEMFFPIFVDPNSLKISIQETDVFSIAVYPKKSTGEDGRWMWGKNKVKDDQSLLEARMIEKRNEYDIFVRDYLVRGKIERKRKSKTIWDEKNLNTQNGTQELKTLLGGDFLSYPKPTALINKCINMMEDNQQIILDFFSGSATTAQAVMQLNAEEGGRRKYILVQLPEPTPTDSEAHKAGYANICEIGKERIRRAGEKIKAELQEKLKGQPSLLAGDKFANPDSLDIGFKVLKLDASNLKKWNPDTADLTASLLDAVENFVPGRTELDLVYEILLKYGADLSIPLEEHDCAGKKVYAAGGGALLLCLAASITVETVQEIVSLKQKLNPETVLVVFRDGGFADDSAKTNAREILRNAGVDEIVSI